MRRGPRLACVLLLALSAAGACSGDDRADEAAAGTSPPDVTVEAVSPTALRVRWETADALNRWWVLVADSEDRSVGQRTACGDCREMTVEHLAPGSPYAVRVVAVSDDGGFGEFSEPVAASTPAEPGCDGVDPGDLCAVVDATATVGDAAGVGLGVLHGVTQATAPARISALDPAAWRVSALDAERFALARAYGGMVTSLLSDAWMSSVGRQPPWSDWARYDAFVSGVVEAASAQAQLPDYWEVQNEPKGDSFEGGAPATPDLVFEQHAQAAAAIRAVVPGAAVIGPSAAYPTFGSGVADIDGFLRRSADAGLDLAGVAWHEIGASCLGVCDGGPRAVLQHADDVRAAIAAAGIGPIELHVNEWGAPWNFRQPGAVVGYLSALAHAGIDVANPACWPVADASGEPVSSCFVRPGTLDGLLLADGSTPTDAWFAHAAYAAMTGPGIGMLVSSIADPTASILATQDAAGTIRVLMGRHSGCDAQVDEQCPPGVRYDEDRTVEAVVQVADDVLRDVTIQRIPSVVGELAGPHAEPSTVVAPEDGRLDLGRWDLADGEALVITLVPRR